MAPAVSVDQLAATDGVLVTLATISRGWLNGRGCEYGLLHDAVRGPNARVRMRERGLAVACVQAPLRSGCELNQAER